jgi:FixJ family two-component response regulator
MHSRSVVYIIAGEPATQRDLAARIEALRAPWKMCRSLDEFLAGPPPTGPACVLAELPRRGEGDLSWLRRLVRRTPRLPIVVIATQAELSTAVGAMKLGIVDFLDMKCSHRQLGEAVREALRRDAEDRRRIARTAGLRRRLARLTPGQRQVLDLLLAGKCNREMAAELDLSVRAVEVRRGKVMDVMRANSLAELVRLAVLADGEDRDKRRA